jgi:hypothetical protein
MTGMDEPDAMQDPPIGPNFTSLYANYLDDCKECHAPGATGATADTEKTLDFSTKATAYTTIKTGMASGLMGNTADCNGVPFLGTTADNSLLLAVLDETTRMDFVAMGNAQCDSDVVTDETARLATAPSAAYIQAMKDWIAAGAPNN